MASKDTRKPTPAPSASARRERYMTNPLPAKVERGPVQNRQAAPRSAVPSKAKVDGPSNAAAAKEVAGAAAKSPKAAPSLKAAASKMTKLAKKGRR